MTTFVQPMFWAQSRAGTRARVMPSKLVTAATCGPVSVDQAKLHLRLSGSEEDSLLALYLEAATAGISEVLGRQLITATWQEWLDGFPASDAIVLPRAPLVATGLVVTYYDTSDVVATLAATEYYVDVVSEPGRVLLRYGKTWPTTTLRPAIGVCVQYAAGYGTTPDTVPAPIRVAILRLTTHQFEVRELIETGHIQSVLEGFNLWEQLGPYRVGWGLA